MTDLDKAVFTCSIPEIQSAIKIGGDGMRVQFQIPEMFKGEGVKLAAMTGKRLRVTVEVEKGKSVGEFEDPYDDLYQSEQVKSTKPKRIIEIK